MALGREGCGFESLQRRSTPLGSPLLTVPSLLDNDAHCYFTNKGSKKIKDTRSKDCRQELLLQNFDMLVNSSIATFGCDSFPRWMTCFEYSLPIQYYASGDIVEFTSLDVHRHRKVNWPRFFPSLFSPTMWYQMIPRFRHDNNATNYCLNDLDIASILMWMRIPPRWEISYSWISMSSRLKSK